mgnify:CR=1 FL=1
MHPFWDLGPRKNPAWSNAAVTRRWNAIERVVGKKHMPLRSGAKLKEYGVGRYGVALPTVTKGVVLKVTTDESEALVASWLAAQPKPPKGVVRYLHVLKVPQEHRGRTVYLLWREEASFVGAVGLWARSKGLRDAWKIEDGLLEQTTSTAQSLVRRILTHPEETRRFREAATRGYKRAMALPKNKMVARFFALQKMKPGKGDDTTVERVLLGARILTHGKVLPDVGRAMLESFRRGVFLSDVHTGNVGVAHRGKADVVVVTDPGNAIPVAARRRASGITTLRA